MGGRRAEDGKIIKRYTGEVTAMEIRYKILKMLMDNKERSKQAENRERGIKPDAGASKQCSNICKREP